MKYSKLLSVLTAGYGAFALAKPRHLADNLEAQLRLAETDEQQLALMLRLAQLRETRMSEVDQAVEIYRQVLDRDSGNFEALSALERARAEIAQLQTRRDGIAAELGQLSGVIEALSVPERDRTAEAATDPSPVPTPDQETPDA